MAACRVERGASSIICQRYSAAASGPAVAVVMAPRNQRMNSLRRKREHAESYVMPRLSMLSSPRCASPERGHRVRAAHRGVHGEPDYWRARRSVNMRQRSGSGRSGLRYLIACHMCAYSQ